MNTKNLEKHEELREFLYHIREILTFPDRLGELIGRLDDSFDTDRRGTETVMGELEAELYWRCLDSLDSEPVPGKFRHSSCLAQERRQS